MLNVLIFFGVGVVAFAALWGWGWLLARVAHLPVGPAPLATAMGLGAVIFAGGWLVLARVAFAPALDTLVLAGLLFAGWGWHQQGRPLPRPTPGDVLAAVPLLLAAWFLARYLSPVALLNHHDDLERYLVYPVKLLATGTLAPNPLGYLGADTLGAGSLLQAFVVAHFPLEYAANADLALLLLCLALAGFALPLGRWALAAVLAELLLLVINPQLVNVSSVFGGAALIMAILLLNATTPDGRGRAAVAGLLGAGMIALKTTFAVFVAVYLLTLLAIGFAPWRQRVRQLALTAAWTGIGLLPWLALHAPLYWAAVQHGLGTAPAGGEAEGLDLFSRAELFYGSTQLGFTSLAVGGILLAAIGGFMAWRNSTWRTPALAVACQAGLIGGAAYFILVAGLGPWMYGRDTATRYAIPILLGTLPLMLPLLASAAAPRWLPGLVLGGGGLLVALLTPDFLRHTSAMAAKRVPWAYAPHYSPEIWERIRAYEADALHGAMRARVEKIQRLVPAGEQLGVWTMAPHLLDFRRNVIWHADLYGVGMPWARGPDATRYFLLEYRGPTLRPAGTLEEMRASPGATDRLVALRAEAFLHTLGQANRPENILYHDDTYVLVRLPKSE